MIIVPSRGRQEGISDTKKVPYHPNPLVSKSGNAHEHTSVYLGRLMTLRLMVPYSIEKSRVTTCCLWATQSSGGLAIVSLRDLFPHGREETIDRSSALCPWCAAVLLRCSCGVPAVLLRCSCGAQWCPVVVKYRLSGPGNILTQPPHPGRGEGTTTAARMHATTEHWQLSSAGALASGQTGP